MEAFKATGYAQRGQTIAEFRASLPIYKKRRELLYLIEMHQVTIVVGNTGTGKTTQLPQYLYESGWADESRAIACTQPRRVAATSVAHRVAEEMHSEVGQTVGYSVRFDEKVKPGITKIKYMTDGMLFREFLYDPLLKKYSVIMVDEAHERSLHTDLLLALLKKVITKRNDLRIVISSATIDAERFLDYFKTNVVRTRKTVSGPSMPLSATNNGVSTTPAIISLDEQTFPLQIHFLKGPTDNLLQTTINTIICINENEALGDILVFLTGKSEITNMMQELADFLATTHKPAKANCPRIFPLEFHGSMQMNEQLAVFKPAPAGHRKVVFATNLAETSLTIDGIVYVVDSGLVKLKVFDPPSGTSKLTLTNISKSSARQRAGRAGRNQAGKVYRMYTEDEFDKFYDFSPSDLQLTDLTAVFLQLKALGIDNPMELGLIDAPPVESLIKAFDNLHALGAVDDDGSLTPNIGRIMSELPLSPQLGKMLVSSAKYRCTQEMLTIVSMCSVGDIFFPDIPDELRLKQGVEEGDLLSYLNIYNAYITNKANAVKWAPRHGLNLANLQKAELFRSRLSAQMKHFGIDISSTSSDAEIIQKCILSGQFMNLAKSSYDNSYRLVRDVKLPPLYIHPDSMLFKLAPEWIVFEEAVETTKLFMQNVTAVEKAWVPDIAPHYFRVTRR